MSNKELEIAEVQQRIEKCKNILTIAAETKSKIVHLLSDAGVQMLGSYPELSCRDLDEVERTVKFSLNSLRMELARRRGE